MNVIGIKYFWQPMALLFIGLKLTGYIDWSWWLVLLPVYWKIAFAFGLVALAVPYGRNGVVALNKFLDCSST
ncbi:transmembrane Fragile-X-F protein [Rhizobium bangladeshense]|uniref:Transmembrane Fragile-X-F protein n=1 Tax=Rhizobium bangladeshense TaxID=1138189 RepID=A0ABS7LS16_9HYPH|nr:hypothetical protein [Rhizobium bangladeshense]MBY3594184.1 transmembrane Fragile-X-F protein [Rhizobium bangladeshense]